MDFSEKLKSCTQREIWDEYCGFLDLTTDEYMEIQRRLLMEQVELMKGCDLGRKLFKNGVPSSVEEFRSMVPLTKFEDYADTLLLRREDMLPAKPAIWLETTWEGGERPRKCAPYTQEMLDIYRTNILAAMILSTARKKYSFNIRQNARVLYSLAPLPYASGLFPSLVDPQIKIKFLPSIKDSQKMSFTQRCKKGFAMSLKGGMDQFYGMTSIVYNMSRSFGEMAGNGGVRSALGMSPKMLARYLRAKYISRRDGRPIYPGDIFKLDGFVVVGTDTAMYKDELEKMWSCRPLELAGGTETCLLGTETWQKNGVVFFPDNCFYEFIPEQDMLRSLREPEYVPPTYLMDEVIPGEKYELVITVFKGGAFMRYRVGDVYRCLRKKNTKEDLAIPQFEYVDRIPTVIDIDGFTRITHREIDEVVGLSGLPVTDYIAEKEYDGEGHSLLRMYVEIDDSKRQATVADGEIFKNHLSIYFRYYDGDYNDLKRLIGVEPLQVTVLKSGTIAAFEAAADRRVERINPRRQDVIDLLAFTRLGKGAANI